MSAADHVEPALRAAREAVARDLLAVPPRSRGEMAPPPADVGAAVAAVMDAAVEGRRWWLSQWPDGAPHVLGLLAQDAQEAVHERDPLWPLCPEPTCPAQGGHALFVEPDLGPDPFWTCHRTGLPVAAVGELRA